MPWPDWQQRHDSHRQPRRVDFTRPGFIRPPDPTPDPYACCPHCEHPPGRDVPHEHPCTDCYDPIGSRMSNPICPAALNVQGEHFPCDWPTDANGEHSGWAHANRDAEAIWADDPDAIRAAWASAEEAGR